MYTTIFAVLQDIAQTVTTGLFASYIEESIGNPLINLRITTAKNRALLRVLESLEPLFKSELSKEQAELLAEDLRIIIKKAALTPSLIAKHRYNLDALVNYCLTYADTQNSFTKDNSFILKNAVKQVCITAIAMSNVLPEWERISWQENFRAFEEVIEKLNQQSSLLNQIVSNPENALATFENSYRKYLTNELGQIYLRGIGSVGENTTLSIETAYIQLLLRPLTNQLPGIKNIKYSQSIESQATEKSHLQKNKDQIKIVDIIKSKKTFVVLGSPGSGKSTLSQIIALLSARNTLLDEETKNKSLVPFLIRVRAIEDFNKLPTPKQFISICAPLLDSPEAENFVAKTLNENRGIILIDGLDECEIIKTSENSISSNATDQSQRDKVIDWIHKLSEIYQGNYFIVTSRPAGYEVGSLLSFGFSEYEILPLSEKQQEDFIYQWNLAIENSSNTHDIATATTVAKNAANNLVSRIKKVKTIKPLTNSPLMLSVICILHKYKGEHLPERKTELLNDCLNTLLYDWRRSHGLKQSVIGDLGANELRALLEPLAWEMSLQGLQQAPEEFIEKVFQNQLPEIRQTSKRAPEIIDLIRDRTGVLLEISPRTFSFAHLLFQEYLAAEECARSKNSYDILLSKTEDPRWKEIIPMAIAASKGNQEILIKALLQHGAPLLAGQALAIMDRIPLRLREEVSSEIVHFAKNKSFGLETVTTLFELDLDIAIKSILELIFYLPVISPSACFNYATTFEFTNTTLVSIQSLAENTVNRCLGNHEFDLGSSWGKLRSIGYYNEDVAKVRGVSWDCLMVNISETTDEENVQGFLRDPIYNYAVMLDLTLPYKKNISQILWENFLTHAHSKGIESEKILMAMHFSWYNSDPDKNIQALLEYLDNFQRQIYPAFQIGIINNAMKNVSPLVKEKFTDQATAIWRECTKEIISQISQLLVHSNWQDGLGVEIGDNVVKTNYEETIAIFKKITESKLRDAKPFMFLV